MNKRSLPLCFKFECHYTRARNVRNQSVKFHKFFLIESLTLFQLTKKNARMDGIDKHRLVSILEERDIPTRENINMKG